MAPWAVVANSGANSAADFLSTIVTSGSGNLIRASYGDQNFAAPSAVNIEQVTANTSIGNQSAFALQVGQAAGSALTLSLTGGSTLTLGGTGSSQAGLILNNGASIQPGRTVRPRRS